jgi:hypothetical protein
MAARAPLSTLHVGCVSEQYPCVVSFTHSSLILTGGSRMLPRQDETETLPPRNVEQPSAKCAPTMDIITGRGADTGGPGPSRAGLTNTAAAECKGFVPSQYRGHRISGMKSEFSSKWSNKQSGIFIKNAFHFVPVTDLRERRQSYFYPPRNTAFGTSRRRRAYLRSSTGFRCGNGQCSR